MNFLLHHHTARAELGSAAGGVGAMLPDLWRMADRRVRPTASVTQTAGPCDSDDAFEEIQRGIEHHVAVDRWFHRAEVFRDGERMTRERFLAASARAPRIGLFAHVGWEMCLDGALVR